MEFGKKPWGRRGVLQDLVNQGKIAQIERFFYLYLLICKIFRNFAAVFNGMQTINTK